MYNNVYDDVTNFEVCLDSSKMQEPKYLREEIFLQTKIRSSCTESYMAKKIQLR